MLWWINSLIHWEIQTVNRLSESDGMLVGGSVSLGACPSRDCVWPLPVPALLWILPVAPDAALSAPSPLKLQATEKQSVSNTAASRSTPNRQDQLLLPGLTPIIVWQSYGLCKNETQITFCNFWLLEDHPLPTHKPWWKKPSWGLTHSRLRTGFEPGRARECMYFTEPSREGFDIPRAYTMNHCQHPACSPVSQFWPTEFYDNKLFAV